MSTASMADRIAHMAMHMKDSGNAPGFDALSLGQVLRDELAEVEDLLPADSLAVLMAVSAALLMEGADQMVAGFKAEAIIKRLSR